VDTRETSRTVNKAKGIESSRAKERETIKREKARRKQGESKEK